MNKIIEHHIILNLYSVFDTKLQVRVIKIMPMAFVYVITYIEKNVFFFSIFQNTFSPCGGWAL